MSACVQIRNRKVRSKYTNRKPYVTYGMSACLKVYSPNDSNWTVADSSKDDAKEEMDGPE